MSEALKKRQGLAITSEEKERFLEALGKTFNVSRSAELISRNRSSLYKLRETDPEFAAAWEEVVERCLDDVEQVVFERALEGKQAVNNIFLLRHRRAQIYGEKVKVEHDQRIDIVVDLAPYRGDKPALTDPNIVDAEEVEVLD
jgi:hypothetical protein